MKKHFTLLLISLILTSTVGYSQSVGVNNPTPDPSAILDISATDKGLLIPRVDSTQRGNIVNPATGLMVYDSSTMSFWYYDSIWVEISTNDSDIWLKKGSVESATKSDTAIYFPGNVAIGKDTSTAALNIYSEEIFGVNIHQQSEGQFTPIGIRIDMKDENANQQYGIRTQMSGDALSRIGNYILSTNNDSMTNFVFGNWSKLSYTSAIEDSIIRQVIGSINDVQASDNVYVTGTRNILNGSGFGIHRGTRNEMDGNGDAEMIGTSNEFGPFTSGSGIHIGTKNELHGDGPLYGTLQEFSVASLDSNVYATYNELDNSSFGGSYYGLYNQVDLSNSTNPQYGAYSQFKGTNMTGSQYGSYTELGATGSGDQYGSFQSLINSGSGSHFGVVNLLAGTASGDQTGVLNSIGAAGDGQHVGVANLLASNGDGGQIGVRNTFSGSGDSTQIGLENLMDNSGIGEKIGVYTLINGSHSNDVYGSKKEFSTSGNGNVYGSHHAFNDATTSTQYGLYNDFNNTLGSTLSYVRYGVYNHFGDDSGAKQFGMLNAMNWPDNDSGDRTGIRNNLSNLTTSSNAIENIAATGVRNYLYDHHMGIYIVNGGFSQIGVQNALFGTGNSPRYGVYNAIYSDGGSVGAKRIGTYNKVYGDFGDQIGGWFETATTGERRSAAVFYRGNVIMNESQSDSDFRVESMNNEAIFMVDASSDAIGLGTESPERILDVRGTSQIKRNSSGTNPHLIVHEDANDFARISFRSNDDDSYWTLAGRPRSDSTLARFNIYSSQKGNVLSVQGGGDVIIDERLAVGASSPEAALHANARAGSDALRIKVDNTTKLRVYEDGHISLGGNYNSGTPNDVYITNQLSMGVASPVYRLDIQNSTSTSLGKARAQEWVTYSDARVKKNVKELSYGLNEIMALRPVSYHHHSSIFNKDGLEVKNEYAEEIGFIAQEVFEIIDEIVDKPTDETRDLWSMNYEKLTPVLVKAIQELQSQNQDLKKKLINQQKQNDSFASEIKHTQEQIVQLKSLIEDSLNQNE